MKKITFYIPVGILFFTAFAVACSQTDNGTTEENDEKVPVVIRTGITSPKATDTEWDPGDAIGVTVYNPDYTEIIDNQNNKKYTTEDGSSTFQAEDGWNLIYFPQNGDAIRIKSYYPYLEGQTGSNSYNVSVADQTTLTDIDLMTAEHLAGFSRTDPNVRIRFYHRLSKLIFLLRTYNNEEFLSFADADLSINGMLTSGVYNIFDNDFESRDAASGQTISVPLRAEEGDTLRQAIVLPREAGPGVTFDIDVPGRGTYIAQMSDTLNLRTGYRYIFYVTLRRGEPIADMEVTIEDWLDGGEYPIIAQ